MKISLFLRVLPGLPLLVLGWLVWFAPEPGNRGRKSDTPVISAVRRSPAAFASPVHGGAGPRKLEKVEAEILEIMERLSPHLRTCDDTGMRLVDIQEWKQRMEATDDPGEKAAYQEKIKNVENLLAVGKALDELLKPDLEKLRKLESERATLLSKAEAEESH